MSKECLIQDVCKKRIEALDRQIKNKTYYNDYHKGLLEGHRDALNLVLDIIKED